MTNSTISQLHSFITHQNTSQFSGLDSFKFQLISTILDCFLQFPTLDSLEFDFKKIEKISKVWEGSNEETVDIGDIVKYALKKNLSQVHLPEIQKVENYDNLPIIPYFPVITPLIYEQDYYSIQHNNPNIEFDTPEKIYNTIRNNFNFLTEEPKDLTALLKECKVKQLESTWCFTHILPNSEINTNLSDDIISFLGAKMENYILYTTLSDTLESKQFKTDKKFKKI